MWTQLLLVIKWVYQIGIHLYFETRLSTTSSPVESVFIWRRTSFDPSQTSLQRIVMYTHRPTSTSCQTNNQPEFYFKTTILKAQNPVPSTQFIRKNPPRTLLLLLDIKLATAVKFIPRPRRHPRNASTSHSPITDSKYSQNSVDLRKGRLLAHEICFEELNSMKNLFATLIYDWPLEAGAAGWCIAVWVAAFVSNARDVYFWESMRTLHLLSEALFLTSEIFVRVCSASVKIRGRWLLFG